MKINFRAGECYLCLLMCDIVVVISFPRKGKETSKAGEGILSEIFFLVYSVSRKNPSVKPSACQLPVKGSLLGATTNQKLSPQAGKVARSAERGAAKKPCAASYSPSVSLRSTAPRSGSLFIQHN